MKKKPNLVPPKSAEETTDSFGHKFQRYLAYRDPSIKHLNVGRMVFEKYKGLFGMTVGIILVMAAQVKDQWDHIDEWQPMKLDGRSLVT